MILEVNRPIAFSDLPFIRGKDQLAAGQVNSLLEEAALKTLREGPVELRVDSNHNFYIIENTTDCCSLVKPFVQLWHFLVKCYKEGFFTCETDCQKKLWNTLKKSFEEVVVSLAIDFKGSLGKANVQQIFQKTIQSLLKLKNLLPEIKAFLEEKFQAYPELKAQGEALLAALTYHLQALELIPTSLHAIDVSAFNSVYLPQHYRQAFQSAYQTAHGNAVPPQQQEVLADEQAVVLHSSPANVEVHNPVSLLPPQRSPFELPASYHAQVQSTIAEFRRVDAALSKRDKAVASFQTFQPFSNPSLYMQQIVSAFRFPDQAGEMIANELAQVKQKIDVIKELPEDPLSFQRLPGKAEKETIIRGLLAQLKCLDKAMREVVQTTSRSAPNYYHALYSLQERVGKKAGDLRLECMHLVCQHNLPISITEILSSN